MLPANSQRELEIAEILSDLAQKIKGNTRVNPSNLNQCDEAMMA
jgi:hypothetical protein